MTQTLVDARTLPPPVRHPRIFETFDALSPGESFVLVNDHYPLPLLYQFQAERPDQFDWSVLEAGRQFRIEIHKRDAREPRGVGEYLTWDHRRLDALWDATKGLVRLGSFDQASERFAEFHCGLSRHIDAEEHVLFPAFERHAGHPGPVEVMRMEHVQIRKAMHEIAQTLAACDAAEVGAPSDMLETVLGAHNGKEEHVLYPMVDRVVTAAERAELVRKMQALPA